MTTMFNADSPILLDTNIILFFQNNLEILCSYFSNLFIHEYVYQEVLNQNLKNKLEDLNNIYHNINFVNDDFINSLGEIENKIYQSSNKELSNTFNVKNNKDIGECKTLLYAKFNNINIISTQDTTVWSFINNSSHFIDIQCMTIQDISMFIYLNSKDNNDTRIAKFLYKNYSREEHKYEYFKKYVQNQGNILPKYIEFEDDRIENFKELINDYLDWSSDQCVKRDIVEGIIEIIAQKNSNSCLNCVYSRMGKQNLGLGNIFKKDTIENPLYSNRTCSKNFSLSDANCTKNKNEFYITIRERTCL